jgi:hypothetical protein
MSWFAAVATVKYMAQDMHGWLAAFAAEIGGTVPTREELDMLLELAGVAAHAAERAAAPLTCWLAAQAGLDPAAALAVGKRLADENRPGAD